MTRYGYMVPESESGVDLVHAIAEHPTSKIPDVMPVWSRWRRGEGFALDWRLLAELRSLGIVPVVYAETGEMAPDEILRGDHDRDLQLLAARSRGALIRIFHEGNGNPRLFRWAGWEIPVFVDVWSRVAGLLRGEGARIAYCVVGKGRRDDDMLDRLPDPSLADVVAFDRFRRTEDDRFPPDQWRYPIERLGSTRLPVWTMETGTDASLTRRAAWISSFANVQGVDTVLAFDFLIVIPRLGITDDWRWNGPMVRAWDALPR